MLTLGSVRRRHRPPSLCLAVLVLAATPAFPATGAATPTPTPAAAPTPAPLEAYGRLPTIEKLALSADGSRLAVVLTVGTTRVLSVTSLDDQKTLGGVRLGDAKLVDIRWVDNRYVLMTFVSTDLPFIWSGPKIEVQLIQSYDLATNELHQLLKHISTYRATANFYYGRPFVVRGAKTPTVLLHSGFAGGPTLVKVDLESKAETLYREGGPAARRWALDDDGSVVAEEDYVGAAHRWSIQVLHGDQTVQTVSGVAALDVPQLIGLSADGSAAIVAMIEDGSAVYRQLALKDGTWGADLVPEAALETPLFGAGSERMIGTSSNVDEQHYRFIDPTLQANWAWVERKFWKQRVEYKGSSADHSRIVLSALGPRVGYGFYLADLKEHLVHEIGKVYAGVDQTAEVRAIQYPAADGLVIPAYLTLPPGRPERNLPIVVMPHGGPQARDVAHFDWWAQALASQGYAVLQPNYRGSDLGRAWTEKGYGEWGRKMQSDVSDGLRYLAKEGIVDAQRACIVGASYGGYAALAGATLEAGTYRCAVAVAGVSDLSNMLRWVRSGAGADSEIHRYWDRFMGATDTSDKRLDEISPLKHAGMVTAPVMLIHGKEDTVVPYEQSVEMEKALKRAGKQVEFVSLDKEDHHLSRSETRLQMLTTSVAFLKKYNPPD